MSSRIGEILVQQGLIDQDQLTRATESSTVNGELLNVSLVKLGFIEEQILLDLLSKQYGLPVVSLSEHPVSPDVIQLLPRHLANKHHLLPLEQTGSTLTVAMVDPSNIVALNSSPSKNLSQRRCLDRQTTPTDWRSVARLRQGCRSLGTAHSHDRTRGSSTD